MKINQACTQLIIALSDRNNEIIEEISTAVNIFDGESLRQIIKNYNAEMKENIEFIKQLELLQEKYK